LTAVNTFRFCARRQSPIDGIETAPPHIEAWQSAQILIASTRLNRSEIVNRTALGQAWP
jgi:hypothetical protein